MNQISKNRILAVLVIILVLFCIQTACFGSGLIDPIDKPDAYKPSDNLQSNNTTFLQIGGTILGAIQVLGTMLSVVMLTVLGLKYMLGSASEKANYKETMIPYLIGAIMVFTIPTVIGIIYELVGQINGESL